jgi:hypothetical protein
MPVALNETPRSNLASPAPVPRRYGQLLISALSILVFGVCTAVVTYLGYLLMFTQYQIYDDEGIFLLALRSFVSGQALYDRIVLPYGPFYFEVFRLLAALGVPLDHDSGRVMSLVLWSAVTLLVGVATSVFTRNLFLGAATLLVSFATSLPFASDPMHPSCLLTLLVIGIEAIALAGAGRWSGRWPWVAIGALVAAALLTKVNVGVFAAIAVAFACVVTIPALSRNPWARLVAAAVIVLLPITLMNRFLDQEWAQRYAGTIALGALAMVVATSTSAAESGRRPVDIGWLFAGGGAVTVVVLAIAGLTGSSLHGLLRGLIIDPLLFRQAAIVPLPLPSTALIWGLIGVGGAIAWTTYRLFVRSPDAPLEGLVRIVVGLTIWITVLGSIRIPGVVQLDTLNKVVLLPIVIAWVVVAPRSTPTGWAKLDFARALLTAMAIAQALQGFPVPGAQVAYGSLPLVPLGAVCIHDGMAQLRLAPATRQLAAAGLFLVIAASWIPPTWRQLRDQYNADVPLGLPGAALVRLPSDQASTIAGVTRFLHDNCDTYISIPGMDSFYIFAELPPPSSPTRWIWVSTDVPNQQAVVDAIKGINRLCVVENSLIIPKLHAAGPMDDYVSSEFVPAETVGSYTILVRR